MQIHKAAKIIPEMTSTEFESLKSDIEKNGLLCPIELYEGRVLDGRHRFKACKQLGIEPDFVESAINEQTPESYVWSLNAARRHLTPSQKAMIAVPIKQAEAKKAKGRQIRKPKSVPEKVPEQNSGDARDIAAALVGVNAKYVDAAEKLYNENPELAKRVTDGEVELSKAKKQHSDEEKSKKRDKESKAAKAKAKDIAGVHHGDFREIGKNVKDSSCALIFTDPPYDRKSLPMFDDLGAFAARVLVPGGSLITYLGQYSIPQVAESISRHLHFLWPICCLHGGDVARMNILAIRVHWKPMLWFINGTQRRDDKTFIDDLVQSTQEKSHHEWQQSSVEARYYIENLTDKNELVCDPFCGGGTTAYCAKALGRKFWTCEINEDSYHIAKDRLSESNSK